MDEGLRRLAKAQEEKEQLVRLDNWGRWNRSGATPNLGYATWGEILKFFLGDTSQSLTIDEIDAQKLEYVISTLDVAGRGGFSWGELWGFCLRVEHMERSSNNQRPIALRAKDVSRKFKRPCAVRTYQHHLQNARRAVFALVEPL